MGGQGEPGGRLVNATIIVSNLMLSLFTAETISELDKITIAGTDWPRLPGARPSLPRFVLWLSADHKGTRFF